MSAYQMISTMQRKPAWPRETNLKYGVVRCEMMVGWSRGYSLEQIADIVSHVLDRVLVAGKQIQRSKLECIL